MSHFVRSYIDAFILGILEELQENGRTVIAETAQEERQKADTTGPWAAVCGLSAANEFFTIDN
ncbi:hypothetical protein DXC51_01715 [Eisenbergiella massiliensis]|uniref:Uncharacterized protein n=1 Tax=Eisenbergiella massiliensis TaxID=1720294 RepID=A0A3E3IDD1_9FIRM|nr:hypothetical protein DXC51_01715 [Eisenbergiella massiliensis]